MKMPHIVRLGPNDAALALSTFATMSCVFEEEFVSPRTDYVARLLKREDFWALAAVVDEAPIGGLTAFSIPLTRSETTELLIYDIAVHPNHQRRGIGRSLMETVRELAADDGICTSWVPAENDDDHALEFYRSIGGAANPVTIFTFEA